MSLLFRKKGEQFFDSNGHPLSNGYLVYKLANTDTVTTVYKDVDLSTPHAAAIDLDGHGRLTAPVFLSTNSVKEELFDQNDDVVFNHPEYAGASAEGVSNSRNVDTLTDAYEVTSSDRGKRFITDTTGGTFLVTLPNAEDVGAGFWFEIEHAAVLGTAVTWTTQDSQIVQLWGASLTSGVLSKPGQRIAFLSDGAGFYAEALEPVASDSWRLQGVSAAGNLTISIVNSNGDAPSANRPIRILMPALNESGVEELILTEPVQLTLTAGSTLGASTIVNVWVVVFNDGGTAKLAVYARDGSTFDGTDWPANRIASAVAEGGAGGADTAFTFYAATTITNKKFISAGFFYTANIGGSWGSTPTFYGPEIAEYPGQILEYSREVISPGTLGTAQIPFDSSTPLISEGVEVFSKTFTWPGFRCFIETTANINATANSTGIAAALFDDSVCAAVAFSSWPSGTQTMNATLESVRPFLSTDVYSIRVGAATSVTVYLGTNASTVFGVQGLSYVTTAVRVA